ncbi:diguanylate cyclase [uncultured Paracoccus sp.]|uniref:diguanylate cyclase n=1 Tax=uncultured Paracoccus sp. TaxID=189685 RepID=UPI0025D5350F|nr:diguanylate cyclase [uncultured Paracoccus sp.]
MTARPVILVVDDEIANIEIASALLDDDYEISFALSGSTALQVARAVLPDLILLDVLMPGMNGYEVCRQLKRDSALSDVPVVFATSLSAPEAEEQGLSAGAIDYVTKPFQPGALRRRVGNHVEMKRLRDQLAGLALQDHLTGLGNRRMMEQRLQAEIRQAARDGTGLAVIMLDIDHFKQFNDTYGHPEGDRCLQQVGAVLGRRMGRGRDICARYGGEEFACILPDTNHAGAMVVAESIRAQIEAMAIPHEGSSHGRVVTVSVGVAAGLFQPGMTADTWIGAADKMLYRSKALGRNRATGQQLSC